MPHNLIDSFYLVLFTVGCVTFVVATELFRFYTVAWISTISNPRYTRWNRYLYAILGVVASVTGLYFLLSEFDSAALLLGRKELSYTVAVLYWLAIFANAVLFMTAIAFAARTYRQPTICSKYHASRDMYIVAPRVRGRRQRRRRGTDYTNYVP